MNIREQVTFTSKPKSNSKFKALISGSVLCILLVFGIQNKLSEKATPETVAPVAPKTTYKLVHNLGSNYQLEIAGNISIFDCVEKRDQYIKTQIAVGTYIGYRDVLCVLEE